MEENLLSKSERNKKALMNGLILALAYIIMVTITNMLLSNGMFLFNLLKFSCYVFYFIIVGFMAAGIRKANGGYIEFRYLFGAIFITLLVAWFIGYLYSFLYMYVIDPNFMNKIKEMTIAFMERNKVPDEALDSTIESFDKSSQFSLKNSITSFFTGLLMDCLFGLIVCAIVKKNRPMFE